MNRAAAVAIALACPLTLGSLVESAAADIGTVRVASNLTRPVGVTHAPGDESRLFIIEKAGRIKILNLDSGTINGTDFLNITSLVNGGTSQGDERGLLGMAFHPDYDTNGYFYVNYYNTSNQMTVRRYSVSANPDVANAGSALTLLSISQPFSNHNGGWIGFGPDGYLYIASGDGGGAGDTGNNAQNTNNLLGTMLRIDVDNPGGGNNYGIPAGNPFVGISGRDEIWAYGLRNPWRNSFDRLTGDLYIGDVGQGAWEEINFQPASSSGGENYGWRCYEGNATFNTSGCPSPNTMTFPIHTYPLAGQPECAIAGGYVYRGEDIPSFYGTYIFGDYCSAKLWTFRYDGKNLTEFANVTSQLSPSTDGHNVTSVVSFGEDARGEIYIVSQPFSASSGAVFRIINTAPPTPDNDTCADAIAVTDGTTNFSNEGATTAGPVEPACDFFGDSNIQFDVWFTYTATCTGELTVGACDSDFFAKVGIYDDSCPDDGGEILACATTGCSGSVRGQVTIPVTKGESFIIRVGGHAGAQGDGVLELTCTPGEDCLGDLNSDGVVNVSDLLQLLGGWGACSGCAEDLNDDDQVNVTDLLILLGAWGACD